jgi:putative inorganic carbon (hco3(-)) transporter
MSAAARAAPAAAGTTLLVGAVAALTAAGADPVHPLLLAVVALAVVALVWVGCYVEPALLFSLGLLLAPFSGNWRALGLPGAAAPDRLVLVGAVLAVLVRTPGAHDRRPLRPQPVHAVLVLAAVWAAGSAALAGTLFDRSGFFRLLEEYGVIPYATFVVAPLVFRSDREREILLRAFVVLGAYLGLTALFETVGARALIFPRYISDPSYGIQSASYGRARGPFTESATNGVALYACAVAAVVAFASWRSRGARACAAAVAALCAVGTLFTLQRAVWLGASLATVVTVLGLRQLRRYLVPVLATAGVLAAAALLLIPGLGAKVQGRSHDQSSISERQNLNAAALAAVEAHPLGGVGWDRYLDRNTDFLQQAPDRPLIETVTVSQVLKVAIVHELVHNVFLGYAAELGLVGLTLWLLALALGVGGALLTRPPPPLAHWRAGLVAISIAVLTVAATVPPAGFPMLVLWLWAGVVWSARERPRAVA